MMGSYQWELQLEQIGSRLLSVQEAANYLQITRRAVYGLVERGTIWSLSFKGQIYIPTTDVESYRLNRLMQREGYTGIMAEDTPYPGVDAHYQSWAQSSEASFKPFITYINELLLQQLPPGYKSFTGDTVTIRKFVDGTQLGRGKPRYPDVSIRSTGKTDPSSTVAAQLQEGASVQLVAPPRPPQTDLAILIAKEADEVKPDPRTGRYVLPVTVIEVLSPANKTTDAREYQQRRYDYWASGLNLIEIDFLHETPPVFIDDRYLRYPQPGAKAYYIAISKPREVQATQVIVFGISQPIPVIAIPLEAHQETQFDFNAAYRMTFSKTRAGDEVDYAQLPLGFHKYSAEDQAFIRQTMKALAENTQREIEELSEQDSEPD